MKFFTKEMIAGWQGPEADHWGRVFRERHESYRGQLGLLKGRVSKRAFRFFYEEFLHDGLFVAFSVYGPLRGKEKAVLRDVEGSGTTGVELQVAKLTGSHRGLWQLKYGGVRRAVLDVPSESPMLFHVERGVGYWEYGEVTDAGPGSLCHEILFSSGAICLVEFDRFRYVRHEISGNSGAFRGHR
jgi:hypothetical protein